ncbi:speckle-type POZ protein B [Caerostris darwini]|uniref:Speckle-type POZ protein B n=1 Tax=Caerostris darwini TaxID=1538125 RepID=A0AAV4W6Q6_9ARAC|nr:speckle-type POZ protein B [Caerostris darwini]
MEKTKWCIYLYPKPHFNLEDGFSPGLWRMSDSKGPRSIKIDCECALLTADGWVAGKYSFIEEEVSKNERVFFDSSTPTCGISADELESFFPNGNLTVRCKMWKCCGEINNDGYCTARTHVGVEKKSSIWSIRNFSTLEKGNELTYKINSTPNDNSIVTLKFSVSGADERLQVNIIPSDSAVESRSFSIKLSVLDSNGDAVTCGEAEFLFGTLVKESKCLLTFTKKDIMRKKSQYLRDDVLSLLYECNISNGLVYKEIENINYGWIPPQTAKACLPDLKLAEILMIWILVLKSEFAAWLASSFTVHQKMAWIND